MGGPGRITHVPTITKVKHEPNENDRQLNGRGTAASLNIGKLTTLPADLPSPADEAPPRPTALPTNPSGDESLPTTVARRSESQTIICGAATIHNDY